ncbi:MAG: acyltransferase family protein [Nostoc sp.]|uniref:acyltransferase n=1 Tax=Nostoc sp. TaxID=1180 RepID=UPI002FFB1B57
MNSYKNIIWVDFIRVFATFSVVLLHSSASLLYKYNELPLIYWWVGNLYNSATRMCVPLFFMLSGYLLLGKTEPLRIFFTKRINKVVVPLFMWSIFYVLWKAYYEKSISISFDSFYGILSQPTYFHLGFLYQILSLYLYLPILRVIVQKSDTKILYYFVTLWILAASVIPFAEKFTKFSIGIDLKMFSGFVGYMLIGYLLGHVKFINKLLLTCLFLVVVSISITAIGTFYLTVANAGNLVETLYEYSSPNIILLSISSFPFLKHCGENSRILNSKSSITIIKKLASASLGIYLIHPIFLNLFAEGRLGFTISSIHGNPVYSIPITAICVFLFSFITVCVLQKTPVINRSVP